LSVRNATAKAKLFKTPQEHNLFVSSYPITDLK